MNSNFRVKTSNLQKIVLVLLLIFLPSQLGLHFWPDWAYINGIRIDYFSPTIYVTDVLVILLFLAELIVKREEIRKKLKISQLIFPLLILTFSLLNMHFSLSPAVTVYKWLKVLEGGFLVWYLKNHSVNLKWLIIPVIYEAILGWWQFTSQSSLGGFWYFLGERNFSSATPGIANAFINGRLVMRPYGTFPHPNVFGGFFVVVFFLIQPRIAKMISSFALMLSLSRTAIVSAFIILPFFIKKKILALLVLIILLALLPRFTSLRLETEPLVIREQLNSLAIEQWKQSPIFGTGLGTSPLYYTRNQEFPVRSGQAGIRNYALVNQPPHNIYLLILSETGILGFALFCWLILLILKKSRGMIRAPLFMILLIGLFDHYFLTLQQGQLLFALVLGLTFASKRRASTQNDKLVRVRAERTSRRGNQ